MKTACPTKGIADDIVRSIVREAQMLPFVLHIKCFSFPSASREDTFGSTQSVVNYLVHHDTTRFTAVWIMPKDCFNRSPYHPLQLTLKDERTLLELEKDLVEDTFRKYEEFVTSSSQVNTARWNHVKSKDDLHIYVKRTKTTTENRRPYRCNQQTENECRKKPIVLSVGTFKGQLDDLMFGTVNPTDDIMHVKASYVHDYSDGAVLATLVKPTATDPFRSVTVKWLRINLPLSNTKLTKDRDFLCLEASGILHFANGERVGYLMLHSIDSPQVQPLPNIVDPGGNIMESLLLSVCANALLSATNYVECGLMKKLTWILQKRQESLRECNLAPVLRHEDICITCNRDLQPCCVRNWWKDKCMMCLGGLCFGCKKVKTISFLSPGRKLVRQKIIFCGACVTMGTRVSALDAARDQANGYQPYTSTI
ncbi:unnamed protein product [Peronospora belbahrii]|uniref:FYVE-type domain-containing protein n=1 Tax=Peronospora belbahrii TaxID=622444 RepID=A0AAU9L2I9_9STRA|nr:unnamed protein product [Peronospora belbahrii]